MRPWRLSAFAVSRKTFGALTAIDNVSVDIESGEFFMIVGPSGCGKTTLLRILAGLEQATAGTLEIAAPRSERPTNAMIFQGDSIFPWMTVWNNAAYGLRMRRVPAAVIKEVVGHYLERTGLTRFADYYPYQLSGGMRQRVSIAREINRIYLDVGRNFKASRWNTFWTIALPGALPVILTGFKLSIGIGLVLIAIAEMIGAKSGLGFLIWSAWSTFAVEQMYAGLFMIALIGSCSRSPSTSSNGSSCRGRPTRANDREAGADSMPDRVRKSLSVPMHNPGHSRSRGVARCRSGGTRRIGRRWRA